MKNKILLSISSVLGIFALGLQNTMAQVPAQPSPDLSMLTNHAALVGYAFKQVGGTQVSVTSGAQAQNGNYGGFIQFTNDVKTLQGVSDSLSFWWFGIPIVSTTDYISIGVQLWNTNDANAVYGGYSPESYVLFNGYGGGYPVKDSFGNWTLPTDSTDIQIQLAPNIRIKVPGLVDARLIIRDQYGNPSGIYIPSGNGEMYFPSDYAGSGELVLTTQLQDTNGYWYVYRNGYALTNGAAPLPITWADFMVLLQGSDDLTSFKNPATMDVGVYTYQDPYSGLIYGKVPLLMATFTRSLTRGVTLSVHSLDGQHATSYIIENQETKVKATVSVPANATSVQCDFQQGDYYIIPTGINLQSPNDYYGGAKG